MMKGRTIRTRASWSDRELLRLARFMKRHKVCHVSVSGDGRELMCWGHVQRFRLHPSIQVTGRRKAS